MPRDFYPRRESDIQSFTTNFSAILSADPEAYGLTPARVDEYSALQQAFSDAYITAQNPGANSSSSVAFKESCRVALEAGTRPLVKTIKGQPTVTDAMRISLGLSGRPTRRHHVFVPDKPPILRVIDSVGGTVRVRLVDAESTRRGLPRDARMALVFGFVGEFPPADCSLWKCNRATSHAVTQVRLGDAIGPGTKVWLKACWTNARGEQGPSSAPIHTYLQDGMML